MTILSIDIGGSRLKAALLDASGAQVSDRERVDTPKPAAPAAVMPLIEGLAAKLPGFERISVGFPGSVRGGVVRTAPNLSTPDWAGYDLAAMLEKRLGKPARVLNDASVQGFGVITGQGLECVITLGTGMGFAIFDNGHIAPHLEMGQHHAYEDMTYDQFVGNAAYKKVGVDKWRKRVARTIEQLAVLVEYDTLLIGGGNAKRLEKPLPDNVQVVDNLAGIAGGAKLWAEGAV